MEPQQSTPSSLTLEYVRSLVEQHRRKAGKRPHYPEHLRRLVCRLVAEGASIALVAEACAISKLSIYRWQNLLGQSEMSRPAVRRLRVVPDSPILPSQDTDEERHIVSVYFPGVISIELTRRSLSVKILAANKREQKC